MAQNPHKAEEAAEIREFGAFFRARDAVSEGLTFYKLGQSVSNGTLEKIAPGLYRRMSIEPTEVETLAMVSAVVPAGIICLLSALRVHQIGTQSPAEVWLALDRRARKPVRLPARTRIVRYSGLMLTYGVVPLQLLGVPTHITTPARTVVDCFRYRNKIGLDIALEALSDTLRSRIATVDEIKRVAEVCRAWRIMRPYMEAVHI